jgi:hypothetical protein
MPSINSAIKTIDVEIPSMSGCIVTLQDDITIGVLEQLEKEKDNFKRMILTLKELVVKWNFDEPVNLENIKKLPISDIHFLIDQTTFMKNARAKQAEKEEREQEKKSN